MKYSNVPEGFEELFVKVRNEYFPELSNAKFLLLQNNKKHKSRGNLVLADIACAGDMVKFLSKEQAPEDGYDYIVRFDGKLVENAREDDLIRVIRHELCHCFVDYEKKKPYRTIDHDVQDFIREIEYNKDNIYWKVNLMQLIDDLYEQEEDDE